MHRISRLVLALLLAVAGAFAPCVAFFAQTASSGAGTSAPAAPRPIHALVPPGGGYILAPVPGKIVLVFTNTGSTNLQVGVQLRNGTVVVVDLPPGASQSIGVQPGQSPVVLNATSSWGEIVIGT